MAAPSNALAITGSLFDLGKSFKSESKFNSYATPYIIQLPVLYFKKCFVKVLKGKIRI